MNKKPVNKTTLEDLYLSQKLNPYEIGTLLGRNHKTIRSYLRKYSIPTRSASEYNFLPRRSHTTPTEERLFSPLSIAAHTAYLCEGWHTEKTVYIDFSNQDLALIELVARCLTEVYTYTTPINYTIHYNKDCPTSTEKAKEYDLLLQGRVYHCSDPSRKNPIVKVKAGGKNLAREFVGNCYRILESTAKSSASANSATLP